MAIRVEEQYAKRTGNRTNAGVTTYGRVYNVISTSGALSEKAALDAVDTVTAATVPKPFEVHPDDARAKVASVSAAVSDATNHIWEITVGYEIPKGAGTHSSDDETEDPCTARPVVRFGSAPYTKIMERAYFLDEPDPDTQGNPSLHLENSAGDPFDPPVQEELNRPIIEIEYNTRRFSPQLKIDLEGTINLTAQVVASIQIPAKKGRIVQLGANPLYDDNDDLYWKMSVVIELNMEGYTRQILDQGFYFLDGDDKKEITLLDKDGQSVPATEPQKLNGSGELSSFPVFLPFETKWPASWAPLNLPRSY